VEERWAQVVKAVLVPPDCPAPPQAHPISKIEMARTKFTMHHVLSASHPLCLFIVGAECSPDTN
jgi:hypothetical protein